MMHFSGHNTDENIDFVQALKKCFLNGFHLGSSKVGFLYQDENSWWWNVWLLAQLQNTEITVSYCGAGRGMTLIICCSI